MATTDTLKLVKCIWRSCFSLKANYTVCHSISQIHKHTRIFISKTKHFNVNKFYTKHKTKIQTPQSSHIETELNVHTI